MGIHLCFLCVLLLCSMESTFAGRLTLLLTFDQEKMGPAVACCGEVRVSEGGRVALREWLNDDKDSIADAKFSVTTEHNAQSAQAAKVRVVRRPTLPKGVLMEVDAPPQATLRVSTELGIFETRLQRLHDERSLLALDGKVRLCLIPNVAALTGTEGEEEYPSAAVMPDGQPAAAYVAWDGKADKVLLRMGDKVQEVTEKPGDYMEPRCAVDGEGKLWVVWSANEGVQWDLWAWREGRRIRLTTNARNDFWPRLARDAHGNLWLAWQTVADDLHYEVMLARLGVEGLLAPINVSEHPADDWEPALCVTPDGRIVVAWDTYRNGSFDIYLREFVIQGDGTARPLGPARPVAASAKREAHATVASDSKGRIWLAWDVSIEDWGKHPKNRGTLHSDRSSDVACYVGGKFQRPAADFMKAVWFPGLKFVEYPHVAVDGQDRLWVVYRVENEIRPFYKDPRVQRAQNYGMWHLFATQYDGEKWSEPVLLACSNGRQDVRVDMAQDQKGECIVVYAADGRTRRLPYVPVDYDVFMASLAGFGVPTKGLQLVPAEDLGRMTPADPDPELLPLPRRWTVGGKTYHLLIGDTHRHTDISRCNNGYDGSLQDAYRYALDACGLDWLAISDHDQDILKHRADRLTRPRQDYDWWRSQKYCDLYTISGRFVALYGYEHGGTYGIRGGHKNVIAAQRGLPVHEVDAPHELFAALAGSGALAIPHQLADGGSRTDWAKWNAEYERLGEIFQARGSYEFVGCPRAAQIFTPGYSMWDALAKRVRIGIIASSDHGQTHQARAGVYVEDAEGTASARPSLTSRPSGFTRQGILEALRARRAFGATTAVVVQVSVAGHPIGEELTLNVAPKIEAKVIAPADIVRMDIVRDGRFIYTTTPNTKESSFTFEDSDLKPGQAAYYYVRAQIGENDFAWSSPVWVTRVQ